MFKTSLEELLSGATNVYRTKNAVNKTAFCLSKYKYYKDNCRYKWD